MLCPVSVSVLLRLCCHQSSDVLSWTPKTTQLFFCLKYVKPLLRQPLPLTLPPKFELAALSLPVLLPTFTHFTLPPGLSTPPPRLSPTSLSTFHLPISRTCSTPLKPRPSCSGGWGVSGQHQAVCLISLSFRKAENGGGGADKGVKCVDVEEATYFL